MGENMYSLFAMLTIDGDLDGSHDKNISAITLRNADDPVQALKLLGYLLSNTKLLLTCL